MREDRRAKRLAQLEAMSRRANEQMEARRRHVEARFDRARQRIVADATDPSEDQQRIVAAALEVLDEVGLQELSLRKLAAKLDFKAPALYWHFKNKETLIDFMAEAILQSAFSDLQPRRQDEAWQDWLIMVCKRLRNVMREHRDGARVIAGAHLYPAVTLLKIFEVSMESLVSAGLEIKQADLMLMTCVHFVFGNVIEEQAAPTLEEIKQINLEVMRQDYPYMAQSIDRIVQDIRNGYDEFEDALRLIIGVKDNKD